ncbi:MAG: hypothetical protein HY390_06285 [Deltaproteobacteria bacterium]|nr:hypothetical protein [Deltaproteobacteria bacterium]
MNPKIKGQILLETLLVLPVLFLTLYLMTILLLTTLSKLMLQWTCFSMARTVLEEPSLSLFELHHKANQQLQSLPFVQDTCSLSIEQTKKDIYVHLHQPFFILGRTYELEHRLALSR